MYYVLGANNGKYIRSDASGNYTPVSGVALATKWEKREKASNILNNCINKNIRNRYRVIAIEEPKAQKAEESDNDKQTINKSDVLSTLSKQIDNEPDKEIKRIYEKIESIVGFTHESEQRRAFLSDALSEVDREISDINHYIEFAKLNASDGYKAYRVLKNHLQKRRQIKDELFILQRLGECKVNSEMLEELKTSITALNDRKYNPRVLQELFE